MKGKNILPISIAVLSIAMTAHAQNNKPNNSCCPPPCTPVCCPPIVEDCCAFTRCPPVNQVTPNAGPRVRNGWDVYGIAAFTYWTAHEDGLAYSYIEDTSSVLTTNLPFNEIGIPSFDWKPGFKVGIGMDSCYDGWDVFLDYTWFRSNSNTSSLNVDPAATTNVVDGYWLINAPAIRTLILEASSMLVVPPNITTFDFYESSNAKWGVQLNVFDLELGRNFFISRRVTLRPYVGLKGMWGRQRFDVQFTDFRAAVGAFDGFSTMSNKISNWGIGIRPGIDTAWHFCESFSVVGEFAFTALWEQFKVTRVDQSASFIDIAVPPFFLPAGTSFSSVNSGVNYYNLKPVIEWFLGFRWETWTCRESFHFAFDAGWEQQIWFGQNQFLRIEALDSDHGDLGIQGLTARFRWDF